MVASSQRPSSARPYAYRQFSIGGRTIETTPAGISMGVRFAEWAGGPSRFDEGDGVGARDPEIGSDAPRLRPHPPPRFNSPASPTDAAQKAQHLNQQDSEDDGTDDVREMLDLPF